jgi:hypothetical protein
MRKLLGKKPAPSVDDQDQMVIEKMRSLGWDMSEERPVENFLHFQTQSAAERASGELGPLGYEASVKPGADGKNWLVQADRRQVVTIDTIRAMRAELTSIATAAAGEYDGWGVGK